MTDITIAAQVLHFNELADKQQEKLINNFIESECEMFESFYDYDCDIDYILQKNDCIVYKKIFEFNLKNSEYSLSCSQRDYFRMHFESVDISELLKHCIKSHSKNDIIMKKLKNLLANKRFLSEVQDNVSIYNNNNQSIQIDTGSMFNTDYLRYKEAILFIDETLQECINEINSFFYRHVRDSYVSCFDRDYAKQELSQVNYTLVNSIIVSQD